MSKRVGGSSSMGAATAKRSRADGNLPSMFGKRAAPQPTICISMLDAEDDGAAESTAAGDDVASLASVGTNLSPASFHAPSVLASDSPAVNSNKRQCWI